jgi:Chemotaxis protein; stimulates methylation of MCP proteins
MESNNYPVDIAMMKVACPPDRLYSLALGSCVGVAIYDPIAHIGGLIHVLLPSIDELQGGRHSRTKFADSGINELVNEMIGHGASKFRMKAKIAGGATMFAIGNTLPGHSIGDRNVASCRETLKKLGIALIAQDVGGNKGRSIYFDIETGRLKIKITTAGEKVI